MTSPYLDRPIRTLAECQRDRADRALAEAQPEYYAANATANELRAILGPGWAIARKTPANLARYGRCITRREYEEACRQALANRRATKCASS